MEERPVTREVPARTLSGWAMLPATVALFVAGTVALVLSFVHGTPTADGGTEPEWWLFVAGVAAEALGILTCPGYFTLQPNEARVLILFGAYRGTTRETGFRWANPFYSNGVAGGGARAGEEPARSPWRTRRTAPGERRLGRYKVSLRARTLNGERLKVNDRRGNPVEIAAVVVWRVQDTAQAVFDVDDYEAYVATQSESALRHVASLYAYDHGEEEDPGEITLRSNIAEVSQALKKELDERLAKAGVVVDETRLTHLAYAPEIAQAMLRRQQAEAVIAARRKIVMGATSMVEMALRELGEKGVVDLDEEGKAAMVSNLMVVLCGEAQVTPVVNAGTLYQ